jgi:hypothetical protein
VHPDRHPGTWLGVSKSGRVGALTNYRVPLTQIKRDAQGRGNVDVVGPGNCLLCMAFLGRIRPVLVLEQGFVSPMAAGAVIPAALTLSNPLPCRIAGDGFHSLRDTRI